VKVRSARTQLTNDHINLQSMSAIGLSNNNPFSNNNNQHHRQQQQRNKMHSEDVDGV
jgi:hypothetical protein